VPPRRPDRNELSLIQQSTDLADIRQRVESAFPIVCPPGTAEGPP
jgi:hypothetical protein